MGLFARCHCVDSVLRQLHVITFINHFPDYLISALVAEVEVLAITGAVSNFWGKMICGSWKNKVFMVFSNSRSKAAPFIQSHLRQQARSISSVKCLAMSCSFVLSPRSYIASSLLEMDLVTYPLCPSMVTCSQQRPPCLLILLRERSTTSGSSYRHG